ncbi:hypothetical protein ALQ66_00657, partial [Pseudomonas savastanoi pv. glycinea]
FARAIGPVKEIYRFEIGNIFGLGGAIGGDAGEANRLDHGGASVRAAVIGQPTMARLKEGQGTVDGSLTKDQSRGGDSPSQRRHFGNLCKKR